MKEEGNRKRSLKILEPEAVLISTEIVERLATGDATVEDLHDDGRPLNCHSLHRSNHSPSLASIVHPEECGCDGLSH